MARLTNAVQTFIVQRLACFETPSEVAEAVAEEFGVEVDRRQVQKYDPLRTGSKPAKKWCDLHAATRERFIEEAGEIPIANVSYRLQELQKRYRDAVRMRNYGLAAELLAQAAKEVGGKFTNHQVLEHEGEVAHTHGVLVAPSQMSPTEWAEQARAQQAGLERSAEEASAEAARAG